MTDPDTPAVPVAWCFRRAALGVVAAYLCASVGCGVERVELRAQTAPEAAESLDEETGDGDEPEPTTDRGEPPVAGENDPGGFDVEPPEEAGCAKVDFLFVVDNSFSMVLHQEKLSRSFPGFMQVVEENLEANDFHIMVVDTDSWDGDDPDATGADRCRDQLGAGKRTGSVGQSCGAEGTERYLQSGQENLSETFSCIAKVGNFGDSGELPMDAMLQATSAANNRAGGCNAGFLRDDAILVVTVITDEDDESSTGNPETWRQTLLAAKGEDPNAIVVLGLVSDANLDDGLPGGPCGFGDLVLSGAPSLQSFVQSFGERGSLASVCADDYSEFFAEAVGAIDTTCDQFVPPAIQ